MMNQGNPGNIRPEMPVKRKRGRPRKDQSTKGNTSTPTMMKRGHPRKDQSTKGSTSAPPMKKRGRPRKDQSTKGSTSAHPMMIPPRGNQSGRVVLAVVTEDATVGKVARAVVARFTGGYQIAVKIENTETILPGIVFKPGYSLAYADIHVHPAIILPQLEVADIRVHPAIILPQLEVAKPTKSSETISSVPVKEHVGTSTSVAAADTGYWEDSGMRRMAALLQVVKDEMEE